MELDDDSADFKMSLAHHRTKSLSISLVPFQSTDCPLTSKPSFSFGSFHSGLNDILLPLYNARDTIFDTELFHELLKNIKESDHWSNLSKIVGNVVSIPISENEALEISLSEVI